MRPITTISTGHDIDLAWPDLTHMGIEQAAHALSQINRFTGHTTRALSVAEHSLMVCDILQRHFQQTNPAVLLAGLLHDVHEALTGDVITPMKALLGGDWMVAENRIQRQVLKHFGVWTAYSTNFLLIGQADKHALSAEREQLLPLGQTWPVQISYPALFWCVYPTSPSKTADDWRAAFIARFHELRSQIDAIHQLTNQE